MGEGHMEVEQREHQMKLIHGDVALLRSRLDLLPPCRSISVARTKLDEFRQWMEEWRTTGT